jgi:hypothetical protein
VQSDTGKLSHCEECFLTKLWNEVKRLATKHIPALRKRSRRAEATEFLSRLQTFVSTLEASKLQQSEISQKKL